MKRGRIQFSKRTMLIVIIVALPFSWFFFRGSLNRTLHVIEIPLVRAGTWIARQVGLFQDVQQVTQNELETYQKEHREFLLLQARTTALEQENARLQSSLGFMEGRSVFPVGADVISRTTSSEQSRLVINRGSDDGVFIGAPVIVEDGLYVGKIVQVSKTQSIVSTLADRDHATAVSLLNQTETIGLVRGLSGNLTLLEFIPLDEQVEVDNLAVTSGLEEFVPSGLLVGFVNTVRPDPSGPFQQAIVEPIVDTRRYTKLIVLLPLEI